MINKRDCWGLKNEEKKKISGGSFRTSVLALNSDWNNQMMPFPHSNHIVTHAKKIAVEHKIENAKVHFPDFLELVRLATMTGFTVFVTWPSGLLENNRQKTDKTLYIGPMFCHPTYLTLLGCSGSIYKAIPFNACIFWIWTILKILIWSQYSWGCVWYYSLLQI